MSDWTQTFVSRDATLRDVLATIDAATLQIALVVDDRLRLLGVITDGDVRRALLRGAGLDTPAREVMTADPLTATPEMRQQAIERLMHERQVQQVPVIDANGAIVGLALPGRLLPRERRDTEVFLMVGGLGSRLGVATQYVPKPMLRVGDKPTLEIILDGLLAQGFHRFRLAVNHGAEIIERYFGNGRRWAAEIRYLREGKRLGTCGALSLAEAVPSEPILVMNGDILTKVRYDQMLDFHGSHDGAATMALREYDVEIPFGVARVDDRRVRSLVEKPTERFLVNGGIYVLDPVCLSMVPADTYLDMPSLLGAVMGRGMGVYAYPIDGYWLDVGRSDDLQRAHVAYEEHWFGDEAAP